MIRHVEIRSSQGMRTRGKYYLHFQTKSYIRLSLWSCCHSDVYGLVPQVADMLIASLADQVAMGAGSQVCPCHYGMCGECLAGFPSICFGTVHVESTHEPPSELACQVSVSLRRSSGAGSLVSHHPRCFLLRAHEVQKLSHTMAGPLFCSLFHSFGVKSQDQPHKSGSALLHEKPGGHKQPLMALKHLIFRKLHAFSNTRLCFTSASLLVQDIGRTLGIRADPITIPHESEPCSFHHPHECAFPKSWVTS